MVSFFALALAVLPVALAQQLTVNTPPSIVQCQPVQLSWSGGEAPYFPSLIPAGQPSAAAIKQFPTQQGTSLTWNVDLPSGSTFTIAVRDSSGTQQFSDKVSVQSGPDSGCINTSVTESGTGGAAAPTAGGPSSGSAPAASTTGGAPTASSGSSAANPSKPTSAGSSASASPSPSNAASNTKGNALAMAGVMGLVGAVLF